MKLQKPPEFFDGGYWFVVKTSTPQETVFIDGVPGWSQWPDRANPASGLVLIRTPSLPAALDVENVNPSELWQGKKPRGRVRGK